MGNRDRGTAQNDHRRRGRRNKGRRTGAVWFANQTGRYPPAARVPLMKREGPAAGEGIGSPVRRKEDRRFLTGRGNYLHDINRPGQAFAVFLRSPYAHAKISGIDIEAAKAARGVVAVYTGADVEAANIG